MPKLRRRLRWRYAAVTWDSRERLWGKQYEVFGASFDMSARQPGQMHDRIGRTEAGALSATAPLKLVCQAKICLTPPLPSDTVVIKHDSIAGGPLYAKLFGSILDSSLWSRELHVRVLFVTMIAMADREGFVFAARPGLARRGQLSREQVDDALGRLIAPDPDSSDLLRNPDGEGRRIEEVDGGWRLLNYPYYRKLRDADNRREQVREAVKRHRAKQRQQPSATVSKSKQEQSPVIIGNPPKASVTPVSPSEAYSEAEKDTPLPPSRGEALARRRNGFKPPSIEEVAIYAAEQSPDLIGKFDADEWFAFYASKGWKVGKNTMVDWRASVHTWLKRLAKEAK